MRCIRLVAIWNGVYTQRMVSFDWNRDPCDPTSHTTWLIFCNKEQIITIYPIDGPMGSSGGGRVRKLSMVCLHNNGIVARGILVTILHWRTPEPLLSATYIVSSVGTSLCIFSAIRSDPSEFFEHVQNVTAACDSLQFFRIVNVGLKLHDVITTWASLASQAQYRVVWGLL